MEGSKKKLNLFDLFTLGLGWALGSGIFVMMGMGISMTGRSIFLAVTIGCLYMTLAYFYQVVTASMFVVPGGYYDMQAMLFTPTLAGVSGIFVYFSGLALAMSAIAMVEYAGMVFPVLLNFTKPIAAAIVLLFFAATVRGSKFLAKLSDIMVIILLISIALFVIFGLPRVQPGYFSNSDGGFFLNGVGGFFGAISIMSWACQGATGAPCSMMLATKNARRTAPLAVILVTIGIAVIYGLMSIVSAGVLPFEQIDGQNLSVVAQAIFPRPLYVMFILGGAVLAIATTLLSTIAMLKEPCMQVANDGWLPAVFKKTTKNGYPYVVQGFFLLIALVSIFSGLSLESLVSLTMIPQMLMSIYLNLAVISLVKKHPEQWKTSILHMPMPLLCILCGIASICSLIVSYNLFIGLDTVSMIACVGIVALCVIVAVVRLKTGAVDRNEILRKQAAMVERAVEFTAEENS